jgi:branched-chain amino acid transport system substrate-binding protein
MAGQSFQTFFASLSLLAAGCILTAETGAIAQEAKPIKIGIVTYLSGAAAGPFGIPAKNAAELFAAEPMRGRCRRPIGGHRRQPVELSSSTRRRNDQE